MDKLAEFSDLSLQRTAAKHIKLIGKGEVIMNMVMIEEKEELLSVKLAERLKKDGFFVVAHGTVLEIMNYIFEVKGTGGQPRHNGLRYELPAEYGEDTLYSYIKMTVSTPLERKVEDMTVDTVLSLGISRALRGYSYLAASITMCVACPDKLYSLNKDVYPEIARKYNVDVSCIERSIRHAICKAYSEDPEPMKKLFRRPIRRPKCQELIAECADIIRRIFY